MGSSKPLMVTASVIPTFSRLSTWSFIRDCKGEITTVRPFTLSPAISAGTWKVIDFPPPVGKIANNDLLLTAALAAFSCKGSPPKVLKASKPKYFFKPLWTSKVWSQYAHPVRQGLFLSRLNTCPTFGKFISTQGGVMEYRLWQLISARQ